MVGCTSPGLKRAKDGDGILFGGIAVCGQANGCLMVCDQFVAARLAVAPVVVVDRCCGFVCGGFTSGVATARGGVLAKGDIGLGGSEMDGSDVIVFLSVTCGALLPSLSLMSKSDSNSDLSASPMDSSKMSLGGEGGGVSTSVWV